MLVGPHDSEVADEPTLTPEEHAGTVLAEPRDAGGLIVRVRLPATTEFELPEPVSG